MLWTKLCPPHSYTAALSHSNSQCDYIWRQSLEEVNKMKKRPHKVKATQSCPTLCDPVDYTAHGILQARILEWVAFPFSRGSSQPKDWTQVSHIADGFFTIWSRWPNIIVNFYFMSLGFTRWHCSISGLPIYTILQSISIVNLYSISLRTLN